MGYLDNGYIPATGYYAQGPVVAGHTPPSQNIFSPSTGPLSGLSVPISANDTTYDGATATQMEFYYQYCPGGVCGAEVLIDTDVTGPEPWTATWTFPSCVAAPEDRFRILAYATDSLGVRATVPAGIDVRLTGRGC